MGRRRKKPKEIYNMEELIPHDELWILGGREGKRKEGGGKGRQMKGRERKQREGEGRK